MKVSQLLENPIGARAPIYHWTEWINLKDILKFGGVGQHDWSMSQGTTNLKDGGCLLQEIRITELGVIEAMLG